MMTTFRSILLMSIMAAASASASVISFTFTGACSDCYGGAGNALGTLTLSATYTLGSPITNANFSSFTYNGTNLQGPFTITNSTPDLSVSGSLPLSLPGTATISIDGFVGGNFYEFNTSTSGAWSVTMPGTDMGTVSSFSAQSTGAPEPATIALLGLGLLFVIGRRSRWLLKIGLRSRE
jgi:hypothetical protein